MKNLISFILFACLLLIAAACGKKYPPEVNFTADKTTLQKGDSVRFTDLSTNNPTGWEWKFTGGTPAASAIKNPVIMYDTVGSFTVTLTAGNEDGKKSLIRPYYITVNQ